jgi:SAM-dependent methyltransferase
MSESTSAGAEALIAEGASVPTAGWDFSWFAGRATEERPPWGYARMLADRLPKVPAVLDIQTGGGEVLAGVLRGLAEPPLRLAATESWPPNLELARRALSPWKVEVVDVADDADLPFASGSFDVVISRHPTMVRWREVARVLRPGATYLSQQVGPGSNRELTDFLMGPQPVGHTRRPERAADAARAAGLVVVDLRHATLRVEFTDVAAVVYFLRKVPWTVPGFSVDTYHDRLVALHDRIETDGRFVAHARRFLIEARKPDGVAR